MNAIPVANFLRGIIEPPGAFFTEHDSLEARCLLLAIAGQESGWMERVQRPVGYARGFWQCEQGGAVRAVVDSDATWPIIERTCSALCIPCDLETVYEAIAWNDPLACVVARMTLLLDPPALPAIGDRDGAWECYVRVWRPGKPAPDRWGAVYEAALACFSPPALAA